MSPAPRTGHSERAPYAAAVITDVLDAWTPRDPAQAALLEEYRAFVVDVRARRRSTASLAPEHLTASCFVLTPDLSRVLLCFHRKGQFWVQLGGHLEPGDVSLADAAYREAREEGGIADLRPGGPLPADVHRHELSAAFGSCRVHWDVGFVAYADATLGARGQRRERAGGVVRRRRPARGHARRLRGPAADRARRGRGAAALGVERVHGPDLDRAAGQGLGQAVGDAAARRPASRRRRTRP